MSENHPGLTLPESFQSSDSTLAGKQVLVTGAATDLGSAICLACAEAGATVLMLDNRARQMESMYDRICELGYEEPMIVAFKLDRCNEQDLINLAETLTQSVDSLDGLAHCALWGAPLAPVSLTDLTTWRTIVERQFMTPFTLTRKLLPLLQAGPGASVVFSTIDTGRRGRAYWGPVAAAFAATESLVQTWGDEANPKSLRINSLDPGKIGTDLRKQFYPAEPRSGLRTANDPLLLAHYLYLLSDHSAPVSGAQFTVPDLSENG